MSDTQSNVRNSVARKKRGNDKQLVDFAKLDAAALKRYKRTYKLRTRHNSTKSELVAAITKHFTTLPVNEVQIIELFLETVNNNQQVSPED